MSRRNDHVEGAAGTKAAGIHRTGVLDVGLHQGIAINADPAAGIDHQPFPWQTHHPLDVGITGRLLKPGERTDQGKVHQQALEGAGPAALGEQHRIKVLGGVEHHDLAAARQAVAVGELLHQKPILELKPRQHRARGDVAGLHQVLTDSQGDRQGDQNAAPELPGALFGSRRTGQVWGGGGGIARPGIRRGGIRHEGIHGRLGWRQGTPAAINGVARQIRRT